MAAGRAMAAEQTALRQLIEAIVAGDPGAVESMLARSPSLAALPVMVGAERATAPSWFFPAIHHYAYAGDTALHLAAAAYRHGLVPDLVGLGADMGARNRRGAQPLHYAADGRPGDPQWDPESQAWTVTALLRAGASVDAQDANGATPLHRAIRTRSAAAVAALLEGGADPLARNRNGSPAAALAGRATGKGGSGSAAARAQQAEIVELLRQDGRAGPR